MFNQSSHYARLCHCYPDIRIMLNASTCRLIVRINCQIANYSLPSATKLQRLCFYTCLSVRGGSASVHAEIPPPPPPGSRHPPCRRLLLRMVRILLECILVYLYFFQLKKLYQYRLGTVNSNTVNLKFHLIRVSLKSLPDSYHFMFKMHS